MLAGTAPPEPEKVKVAFAGQAISGMVIVNGAYCPGAMVPPAGLKLTPLN